MGKLRHYLLNPLNLLKLLLERSGANHHTTDVNLPLELVPFPDSAQSNPFSEEDENDESHRALVTSSFSRMKNSLAAPLPNSRNFQLC